MQIEKKDKEVCISIAIPINETEPDQCPKVECPIFGLEKVQQHLHNVIITRMEKCCMEVGKMLANGSIKADEHCMYGSGYYFSFAAFDAMRQLAAQTTISLEDCTFLQLNQILKSLVYLPDHLDIKIREKIFDVVVDELVRKGYEVSIQNNNQH